MKVSKITAALMLTLALAGCGPTRVNLAAVRGSFDRHKPFIQDAETRLAQQSSLSAEIVANTATPSVSPYPAIKLQIDTMKRELIGMKEISRKIEAFKPKFDRYAKGKAEVSNDKPEEWNAYQAAMGEYYALTSEMEGANGRFNAAENKMGGLIKQYNIGKVSLEALQQDCTQTFTDINSGIVQMKSTLPRGEDLLLAALTGHTAQMIIDKRGIIKKMENLVPEADRIRDEALTKKDAALASVKGTGEVWAGPGMKKNIDLANQYINLGDKYLQLRKTWDQHLQAYDNIKPAPAPAPAAGQ